MDQVKTNEEIKNKQDQKVSLPHKNSKLFLLKSSSNNKSNENDINNNSISDNDNDNSIIIIIKCRGSSRPQPIPCSFFKIIQRLKAVN